MHQAYFVYKITCSVNEKSYIGISVDPQRRLRQHRNKARIGSGYALHNAMRKHGVDTFTMEVLMEVSTEEDALQMEEKLILENNTVAPAGYNLTVGGETPKGNLLSEKMTQMWASKSPEEMAEFKKKMKTVGADISEETRQKRSAAAKAQHADPEKEAQMKATLIAASQDPERRKGNSERAKARWADPAFRTKMQDKSIIASTSS
jgi:group I intron endonuclease